MKNNRQEIILQIVAEQAVETQEQLITCLRERGIESTQATISRDIKQLHLVKEPMGNGHYRYSVSLQRTRLNFADRLKKILHESVVGVDFAQNIVVLHTIPGLAGAAGAAFDAMELPSKVGTLAGDDTVMIVMRTVEAAEMLCGEIGVMRK